jgi:uncharacterized protein (UPF0333 family)
MLRLNKRGQSALEYAVLLAVIVAALVAMQVYVKRAGEGRLKESADDLGSQYEPGKTDVAEGTLTNATVQETTGTDGQTVQSTTQQKTSRWATTTTGELSDTNWP